MEEADTPKPKRRGRGPAKKPRLVGTSIRLSKEVMDFFNEYHPRDKQAQMRAILTEYVRDELKLKLKLKLKEPQHGTQSIEHE